MTNKDIVCTCEECAKLPVEQRTKLSDVTGRASGSIVAILLLETARRNFRRGLWIGVLIGAGVVGVVYWIVR